MFKTIGSAADCEIWSVIRFLSARNVIPSEINNQICQVYGDNAKSDGMVRKWVRMFKEGRENVHDEARSGRPSVVNDDLVSKVNEIVRYYRLSQFLICPCTFLRFQGLLYDTGSSHSGYRKVCARWVPKMLTEEHIKTRLACALTFLMRYHKEGDGMLRHIVTGDKTWVSHITPESKQQSLHWKLTGSPKRKTLKRTFSTRNIMCTVFWDKFIHPKHRYLIYTSVCMTHGYQQYCTTCSVFTYNNDKHT